VFGGTVAFLGLLMPLPGAHHAGAPSGPAAWYAIVVAAVIAARPGESHDRRGRTARPLAG